MSPSATLTNEHIEEWRALVPYFFSLLFAFDSITALNTRGGSQFWRWLREAGDYCTKGLRHEFGNGKGIKFWWDIVL